MAGNQAGTGRRNHGRMLSIDSLSSPCLASFLMTTCPGDDAAHSELGLPISINNDNNLPISVYTGQSDLGSSSAEVSSLRSLSRLCQVGN